MPTKVRCKCGHILIEFPLMPENEWYENLYAALQHKCPHCGHELPNPDRWSFAAQFEVKPNPATKKKSPMVYAFDHGKQWRPKDYHNRERAVETRILDN